MNPNSAAAQVLGSTLAGASTSTITACSYCAQYVGGNGNMTLGYSQPNTIAASWEACAPAFVVLPLLCSTPGCSWHDVMWHGAGRPMRGPYPNQDCNACRWAGYMQGNDVEIASDAVWSAKTTANFASYQAIVFGDGRFTDDTAPGKTPPS